MENALLSANSARQWAPVEGCKPSNHIAIASTTGGGGKTRGARPLEDRDHALMTKIPLFNPIRAKLRNQSFLSLAPNHFATSPHIEQSVLIQSQFKVHSIANPHSKLLPTDAISHLPTILNPRKAIPES